MSDAIRPEVREQMKDIGRLIGGALPPGFGFALLVFDMNTPSGYMNWISNAKREDMLTALKEFIAHAEGRVLPDPQRVQ